MLFSTGEGGRLAPGWGYVYAMRRRRIATTATPSVRTAPARISTAVLLFGVSALASRLLRVTAMGPKVHW